MEFRDNLPPGPITAEMLFNVFPFENTITTLYLSGAEVQEMFDFIARRSSGPYLVLVVPLLVETGYIGFCDRVLVIDAPPALQLERLMQRDGIDAAEASAMLAAQADRATRLAAADDRIDNSGDIRHLLAQTDGFHRMYSELARAQDPTP